MSTEEFKCPVSGLYEMQKELIYEMNTSREELYSNPQIAALYGKKLKKKRGSKNLYLPFDHILEAEALGGEISCQSRHEIRILNNKNLSKLSDFLDIKEIDLSGNALRTVVEAANILRAEEIDVVFHVSGPATILNQFFESTYLLRQFVKDKTTVKKVFNHISELLNSYIDHLVENKITSFSIADPICSADILGEKKTRELTEMWTFELLENQKNSHINRARIQMCPRLFAGLSDEFKQQKNIPAICPEMA